MLNISTALAGYYIERQLNLYCIKENNYYKKISTVEIPFRAATRWLLRAQW